MYGLKLYGYWRSSASYRVRIALNLKGLTYEQISVDLLAGEQNPSETGPGALDAHNPQHMVPVLMHGERVMRQSLAIIEWLEEHFEGRGHPLLSATDARERVRVRSIAQLIACDVAPINVLRVLAYLEKEAGFDMPKKLAWMQHWMREGFTPLERLLDSASTGAFCEGDAPTLADCCLIPQVYNAKRWQLDMAEFPIIERIYQHAMQMQEFIDAAPENQADAS
jgi:maleylacetoacetate isomerase